MQSWSCIVGGMLVVLEASAQPPVALMHVALSGDQSKTVEVVQSSIDFDIRAGLVLVEAVLEGSPGLFVIDTGAPGLILNQKPEGSEDLNARGVTGSMEVEEVRVEEFRVGSVRFSNLRAYKIDLSHLEERLQRKIDGLIGYDVLKEIEMVLDYPARTMTLLPLFGSDLIAGRRGEYLDFSLVNHIPAVSGQLGKRDILLGLDTGAGANVLNTSLGRPYRLKNGKVSKLRGANRNTRRSAVVQAPVVIEGIEDSGNPLDYWLMDLSQLHTDLDRPIDGVLGFPFVKQWKWSIHYGDQKIYLWNSL
ncbi:MAG: aspartyl protease family protein [Saprospirales bacterium]|nr:aspartyl protease family protein [Saprospirales bacterium]